MIRLSFPPNPSLKDYILENVQTARSYKEGVLAQLFSSYVAITEWVFQWLLMLYSKKKIHVMMKKLLEGFDTGFARVFAEQFIKENKSILDRMADGPPEYTNEAVVGPCCEGGDLCNGECANNER